MKMPRATPVANIKAARAYIFPTMAESVSFIFPVILNSVFTLKWNNVCPLLSSMGG